jgi:hypothetical protein
MVNEQKQVEIFAMSCFCFILAIFTIASGMIIQFGFVKNMTYNNMLISTQCTVIRHLGVTIDNFDNCAHNTCYDSHLEANYTIYNGTTLTSSIRIANDEESYRNAEVSLNSFPVESRFDCYYEKNNPIRARIDKLEESIFIFFGVIFAIIAAIFSIPTTFIVIFSKHFIGVKNNFICFQEESDEESDEEKNDKENYELPELNDEPPKYDDVIDYNNIDYNNIDYQ